MKQCFQRLDRKLPAARPAAGAWSAFIMVLMCPWAAADDLLFVYRLAVENDPRFRAAIAIYKATQEAIPQARANLLPTLNATAALHRNAAEVTTDSTIFSRPAGEARYRSDEYKLTLTQPIYNAAAWANLRQANADVRRAKAEYQAARHDLILRVAEAYFEVLKAQDALTLAKAEKDALMRNLETVEGRRKAGLANITEINDARARYELSRAQEIEAANNLDDAHEALREISGQVPGTLSDLRENAAFAAPDPPEVQAWIASALEQNPSVRAATEAAEVAREAVERNRTAHFPTLDAVGTRSRLDSGGSVPGPGFRTSDTVVGLQLSIPIFQGGVINARTREAMYRFDAALHELEGQRRAVERAIRAAFQGTTSGAVRIDALRQAVIAAESALTAKNEGRAVGLYTTLDILDSTRDLYKAKRDYAEARQLYLLNFLSLKGAAGTLSEDDILNINRWLN